MREDGSEAVVKTMRGEGMEGGANGTGGLLQEREREEYREKSGEETLGLPRIVLPPVSQLWTQTQSHTSELCD